MKKLISISISIIISLSVYSQSNYIQNNYTQSDSIDKVALKYFNIYRVYNKLPKVKLDTTMKQSCVKWGKESSLLALKNDSCYFRIYDSLRHISGIHVYKDIRVLNHTKPKRQNYSEVITYAQFDNVKISDTTSQFAIFVQTVFKKKIKQLTGTDVVILMTLFNWDTSKKGHKEIIRNPSLTKIYYSVSCCINRPGKLKNAAITDKTIKCNYDKKIMHAEKVPEVRCTYVSIMQLR